MNLKRELRNKLADHLTKVKKNATYAKPAELSEFMRFKLVRGLLHSMESGRPYRFIGEAGIGKTSFVNQICRILGLRLVVIPAAQISIENLMLPFPIDSEEHGRKVLEMVFYRHFTRMHEGDEFVIYIDEPGRGDATIGNTLMELIQEKTLAGRSLDGLVTVVATDNPEGHYGRMASLDFSQADRFFTEVLDSNDTPWRRALAEKFPDIDLAQLFTVYGTLDENVRRVLNPRVLDHMIQATMAGFPAVYALPIVLGERVKLVNKAGAEVTETVLQKVCAAIGVAYREKTPDVVRKAVDFALETGNNIFLEGAPGIGKTSYLKALLRQKDVDFAYDSAAMLTPEDMTIPFPGDGGVLELMPTNKFLRHVPFVWLLDEVWRGNRRTQSAIMPILQERELGGEPINNLICTIALNNPKMVPGTTFKLDVGKCDLAAATRFALSIQLVASDIPATTYLFDKYGEELATPFVEWWQDDLDDTGRALCTPRALERLIEAYAWDGDNLNLKTALPYVNGDYVAVPLTDLTARLAKRPLARLRKIAANEEEWVEKLTTGDETDPDFIEAQATVYLAFQKAELKQLQEHYELCVRLMALLTQQNRITLVRTVGDRQAFWLKVLQAGAGAQLKN
jgi:MoxR-like ATPase